VNKNIGFTNDGNVIAAEWPQTGVELRGVFVEATTIEDAERALHHLLAGLVVDAENVATV
jgi:hypothetical protein